MREHSTGQTTNMVPTQLFNHRLKDAFMTAARNVVYYNPDSHIAGYHRNLVKAGMSPLEATKRVARALVRVIYRKLSALLRRAWRRIDDGSDEHQEEGESGMASGTTRSGQSHISDISLSSPRNNRARSARGSSELLPRQETRRILGGGKQFRKKTLDFTKTIYGYKDHVKVDTQSKLITTYEVTDASVHDSQVLPSIAPEDRCGHRTACRQCLPL